MKNSGIRIIRSNAIPLTGGTDYDYTHSYMRGYTLDLSRKTGALIRQSRKGAGENNPESRLRQEGLSGVAVDIREDHDPLMVLEFDEGAGVSGQKKIYDRPKFLELWEDILNNIVGSVVVVREDRLFRHRFITQPSHFAEECAKRGVLVIVAGYRCYDFNIKHDYDDFMRKMQEAYGYIDTHIKYMSNMRNQKHQRGEWVGGALAAPYALDKLAIIGAREQRKIMKEYGADSEEEAAISQAFRPVIYTPWQPIAVELFQQFRLFNFSRARLGRYIEDKKSIFPLPSFEDTQKYIIKTNMKLIAGRGYTFSDSACLGRWMTNVTHLGFASVGTDEDGNKVYIEDAFEAAIDRELFDECYEAITGYTLEGKESATLINRSRFTRKHPYGQAQALLAGCFSSPEEKMCFTARRDATGRDYYVARVKRVVSEDEVSVSIWEANSLWALQVAPIDRAIVSRLAELAEYDKELANRVEQFYGEMTKNRAGEKKSILQDIRSLEALIARYDELLTDPAQPLSKPQEKRYLTLQAQAEMDLEQAQRSLAKYEASRPDQFIPAFYRILGEAPGEFWKLDIDRQKRMIHLLVDSIEITPLSPHIYSLRLKWKDVVAQPWDCALIYRRNALRNIHSLQDWTDEEVETFRRIYPTASRMELYAAFPMKSGVAINQKAHDLQIKRSGGLPRTYVISRSLCLEDWTKTCEALHAEQDSEEGQTILNQLNYIADNTESKGMSFWWLLPVMQISDFEAVLSNPSQKSDLPLLPLCG